MSYPIEERFKQAKIRLTPQRALIVETLVESSDHPDADLIYRRAMQKDSSISVATTYRTLNLLGEAGIAVLQKVFGIILLAIAVKLFSANAAQLFQIHG